MATRSEVESAVERLPERSGAIVSLGVDLLAEIEGGRYSARPTDDDRLNRAQRRAMAKRSREFLARRKEAVEAERTRADRFEAERDRPEPAEGAPEGTTGPQEADPAASPTRDPQIPEIAPPTTPTRRRRPAPFVV